MFFGKYLYNPSMMDFNYTKLQLGINSVLHNPSSGALNEMRVPDTLIFFCRHLKFETKVYHDTI